ncbi:hypothetical protein CYLTODRAFT_137859 [Cylindrobasidium torrendii FP15055 ss-10]|uniref:Uncharacterized protein n=1 Tax=Cylindrobasidium torrendii FP15055 ss-10 TaxID=1314674 RepID=A0A0D7AYG9_9AGAR|nr:hypothetical protein CYLTODRAFT_137859 [Cylindrobasidium torrendii FP15055 ss-10]
MLSNPRIVLCVSVDVVNCSQMTLLTFYSADFSHWSSSGTIPSSAPSLMPEMALFCGLRATKRTFPIPEFPEGEEDEPLKIGLEYIRCSLPPSPNLSSVDLSQVTVPTLPKEILLDNEAGVGPPCTLEKVCRPVAFPFSLLLIIVQPEDIETFLNFCAAAQIENWIRFTLKLEPIAPLDAATVTYLMDNIPTFLKVSELCKQANATLGGNAALYGECFDLMLGAHGGVSNVYKRLEQHISTPRQRLFDEQHTLSSASLETR